MKTWPSTVPAPENDLTIKPGSNLKERKLMSGRREVRRFGSGAPDNMSVKWILSAAELAYFDTFYMSTLNLGTNWFTASWLPTCGYSTHAARFFGHYQQRILNSDLFEITATLIVQTQALVPVADTSWPTLRT